jgi:hypothetical protein
MGEAGARCRKSLLWSHKYDRLSEGVELLRDIRPVFEDTKAAYLSPEVLRGHLLALEETAWKQCGRNKHEISTRFIAQELGEIKSAKVRGPRKYYRKEFDRAFESYLPPLVVFASGASGEDFDE